MGLEGFQRAIGKPFGRARRREISCACKNARKNLQKKRSKTFVNALSRRGRSPSGFYSYPPALPTEDWLFASKINFL